MGQLVFFVVVSKEDMEDFLEWVDGEVALKLAKEINELLQDVAIKDALYALAMVAANVIKYASEGAKEDQAYPSDIYLALVKMMTE